MLSRKRELHLHKKGDKLLELEKFVVKGGSNITLTQFIHGYYSSDVISLKNSSIPIFSLSNPKTGDVYFMDVVYQEKHNYRFVFKYTGYSRYREHDFQILSMTHLDERIIVYSDYSINWWKKLKKYMKKNKITIFDGGDDE